MKKIKRLIEILRLNPRYIFLIAALITQGLEVGGIVVSPATVEFALDLVTLAILGRVMKKSETDKLI